MEASDSDEEIVDLNEAQTNSKTIEKKENTSKSSLKKVKWSKTKFSVESISQIVKSENDQSFYENEPENEKEYNENDNEKEEEKNIEDNDDDNNKENVEKNDNNETKNSNTSFIYTFTWEEGGNDVKLIGSFSNWKDTYEMKKDVKDNVYKISLPLNNEIYYYKFIVDGEWKYAQNQQTKKDNDGNINNFLDLTNFFMNFSQSQTSNEPPQKKSKKSIKKKKSNKLNIKKKKIKSKKEITEFGTENIDKNHMTEPHNNNTIGKPFNLNNESKQDKIGNQKFYDFNQRNFYSSHKSYITISGYRHNVLEHILMEKNNKEQSEIKIGLSHRYREKATTIIYYNCVSKIKS